MSARAGFATSIAARAQTSDCTAVPFMEGSVIWDRDAGLITLQSLAVSPSLEKREA